MKRSHHTTLAGTETTFNQAWTRAQELGRLRTQVAPRFVRPEPRRCALAYLRGSLSEPRAKMAGIWTNTSGKPDRTACSACFGALFGMQGWSMTICVTTCLSNWA